MGFRTAKVDSNRRRKSSYRLCPLDPNAMPSFSVKCMRNQSPIMKYSWPRYMLVFTHIFSTWSSVRTSRMMAVGNRAFFKIRY